MKLKTHDINRLNPIFHEWFRDLWSGSTSQGRQELIDANQTYCLIRIKHHGFRRSAGFTEWLVVPIGADQTKIGASPESIWTKSGRLTNSDLDLIFSRWQLIGRDHSRKS